MINLARRASGTAVALCLALGFAPFATQVAYAEPNEGGGQPPSISDSQVEAAPAAQTGGEEGTGTLQETDAKGKPIGDAESTEVPAPPLTANEQVHRTEMGDPVKLPTRPSMKGAAGAKVAGAPGGKPGDASESCEVSDFAQASGAALVTLVTARSTGCVNSLFSIKGADAKAVFVESKMITIANAMRDASRNYPGNNTTSVEQLVLFLRAGYYVHWYNVPDVGSYGKDLDAATGGALDAFFASEHSRDVNNANGEILGEVVILVDSSELNALYLDEMEGLLKRFDETVNSLWWMRNATNNVFIVFFRGHQFNGYNDAVAARPSVLQAMYDFAVEHLDYVTTDSKFMVVNAARELARCLSADVTREATRALVVDLIKLTSLSDDTAPVWVGLADMVNYYDYSSCAAYGTCDAKGETISWALPQRHDCGGGIVIRSQSLTDAETENTCTSLLGQERYFHAVAKDPGQVPDDLNQSIEVVVFGSSTDYQTFAGIIFGIDTNNGGMYLEGNPAVAGNQPRFIAYEATWQRPVFAVWNLNHEYTHYLDGRFDMYGDFGAGMQTPTIWWVEGFAEYISWHYRALPDADAENVARDHTYKLSELFDTAYGDQDRVYRWGYLASAFMLNEHPVELQKILTWYRAGNWTAARNYIKQTIGTSYDAEFNRFVDRCAAHECWVELGGDTKNEAPTSSFTATTDHFTVNLKDTSTDSDGKIVAWAWKFDNGETSNDQNPSVTYQKGGEYRIELAATDDLGAITWSEKKIQLFDVDVTEGVALSSLDWVGTPTITSGKVRKNRSVDDHVLTLDGKTYSKGIGTHAESRITYDLAGAFSKFKSDIGTDGEVKGNPQASVGFEVWGDGVRLFKSDVLTPASDVVPVDVSVAGVNKLELVVTDGGNGINSDHADWAGARLIPLTSEATVDGPIYLSDLSWKGTPTIGYREVLKDKSVDNHVLTVNGKTFEKGLGTHADSRIKYDLGGAYATFKAEVGVDDEVGWNSTVVFEVWGDGVRLFKSDVMTPSSDAVPVNLQVAGVKLLELVVTDAGDGINSDHADWADARVYTSAKSRTTDLSELNWTGTPSIGYGTVHKNRSVDDHVLTLNGTKYETGLGTHATSRIKYDLGGAYSTFKSDIGVDDEVGWNSTVVFEVWGDGVRLFKSDVMTPNSDAVPVSVPVAGVKVLELVVTDAGDGINSDHADWAGAKLLS